MINFKGISVGASIAATAFFSVGCATTAIEIPSPALEFTGEIGKCTSAFDFSDPIARSKDEKSVKKQLKHQRIYLQEDMGFGGTGCTLTSNGEALPYAAFEIPADIEGRVVSAGAKLQQALIFAADISTYADDGQRVRRFQREDFRRLGSLYGVQFTPRVNETFVVIQANPNLVGNEDSTVETAAIATQVNMYHPGGVSSGTNTVGVQRAFNRTYAYNGVVAVQTVFPKVPKK